MLAQPIASDSKNDHNGVFSVGTAKGLAARASVSKTCSKIVEKCSGQGLVALASVSKTDRKTLSWHFLLLAAQAPVSKKEQNTAKLAGCNAPFIAAFET